MTQITNENFDKMFPIIKDSIKKSSFIGFYYLFICFDFNSIK